MINLRWLDHCIKFLPRLNDNGLVTSKYLTLSYTQLCGIVVCGCKKEWADQYGASVGGIPINIDALLKKFEVYKKLNESKQQSTPILLKPAMGRGGGHGSKCSGGSHGNGK